MTPSRVRMAKLLGRLYPFLSGRNRAAHNPLARLAMGDWHGEVGLDWAKLTNGREALVPVDDYMGRTICLTGDIDRKISSIFERVVRPGDHVLDIGANMGIFTTHLANLVGASGVVHSFEPNPSMLELLQQTIARNDLKNIRLHTFALGNEECTLELAFPSHGLGKATLTSDRAREDWNRVSVPVRPLASVADEFDFSHVRLLKIDVEGFEAPVFEGGRRWLEATPPAAVVFESNGRREDGEPDPVPGILAGLGYQLYTIPKALLKLRLKPYRPTGSGIPASHDMLALHERRAAELLPRFHVG